MVDLLDLIRKILTATKTTELIEKMGIGVLVERSLAHDHPDFGA